eukprot:gene12461-15866_t
MHPADLPRELTPGGVSAAVPADQLLDHVRTIAQGPLAQQVQ